MSPGKNTFFCLTVCPISHLHKSFISEVIEALGKRPLHCDCSRVSQVNESRERGCLVARDIRHGRRGKKWDQSKFSSHWHHSPSAWALWGVRRQLDSGEVAWYWVEIEVNIWAWVQSIVCQAWVVTLHLSPLGRAFFQSSLKTLLPLKGTETLHVLFSVCPRCYTKGLVTTRGCAYEMGGISWSVFLGTAAHWVWGAEVWGADDRAQFSVLSLALHLNACAPYSRRSRKVHFTILMLLLKMGEIKYSLLKY